MINDISIIQRRKLGTDASHQGNEEEPGRQSVRERPVQDGAYPMRAKEIRGDVDKVITCWQFEEIIRLAIAAALGDKELVREIFEKVEQRRSPIVRAATPAFMQQFATVLDDNAPWSSSS